MSLRLEFNGSKLDLSDFSQFEDVTIIHHPPLHASLPLPGLKEQPRSEPVFDIKTAASDSVGAQVPVQVPVSKTSQSGAVINISRGVIPGRLEILGSNISRVRIERSEIASTVSKSQTVAIAARVTEIVETKILIPDALKVLSDEILVCASIWLVVSSVHGLILHHRFVDLISTDFRIISQCQNDGGRWITYR